MHPTRSLKIHLLTFLLLSLPPAGASAAWPARVFAPYVYLGASDKFKLAACDDATGQKFFTLAFIIADPHGNPAWDGRIPLLENFYADQIAAIRRRGGDVIISFGGEGGTELAIAEKDPAALEQKYQAVINQYRITWVDMDIEGDALLKPDSITRRNIALASLQRKNPGLIVTYTLPVGPGGISPQSKALLADAKAKGVIVKAANVMTMDFGEINSKGRKMSDVSIASVLKAYEQCQAVDERIQIGITPMIGVNDVKSEIFSPTDAVVLRDWAVTKPWVFSFSFWSANRDANTAPTPTENTRSGIPQSAWEFTKLLQPFTTPAR